MKMKELISELREVLGEDYVVESKIVEKPNGVRLQGIVIKKEGDRIAPTIYVNEGMTAEDVVKIYNDNKGDVIMNTNPESFMDSKFVLENVIPVMYNRELSSNILSDAVTVSKADLEMAFRVVVAETPDNRATFLVKKSMLEQIGITEQELYDASIANIQGKGRVCDIMQMILGLSKQLGVEDEIPEDLDAPMVVITGNDNMFGAAMIFDESVRERLTRRYGEYYILPSSINELIAVPKDGMDVGSLMAMVKEINGTQVAPGEVLSDNVYVFTDELEVA